MRRRVALIAALITGVVGASAGAASAAPPPSYTFLHPGGLPALTEKVPVNIVFLGYGPNRVGKAAFLAGLPTKYEPVVRSRLAYGNTTKLGITYTYDYHVSYGNRSYEDGFFKQLGRLAKPAPLTQYQKKYRTGTPKVTCPAYLKGEVGATITCQLRSDTGSIDVEVKVTRVDAQNYVTYYSFQQVG